MSDIAKMTEQSNLPVPIGYENYFDISRYNQIGAIAKAFSMSDLIPAVYKDKPANCFIAIHLGMKLGLDPFLTLQNIYIVQGNPCLSAKLCISLANRSGIFDGNIIFTEFGTGDDLAVTASARLKNGGQTVSKTMTLKQAKIAGWTSKPVWQSQPSQMLSYRTATQLIRLYCPDAIMGMSSVEEWEDVANNVQQRVEPASVKSINQLLNSEPQIEDKPLPKASAVGRKPKKQIETIEQKIEEKEEIKEETPFIETQKISDDEDAQVDF